MRRIDRQPLSTDALRKLAELQRRVQDEPSPRVCVQKLWDSKPKAAFAEIRETLQKMAPGRSRCMYCEDSMATDIEHFWPKLDFPMGAFCWNNYLLACSYCNSNLKRDRFPRDERGDPLLVDPTSEDDPGEHLLFLPSSGEFRSRSRKGDETIDVFGLNDDSSPRRMCTGRKRALRHLKSLLLTYDREVEATDPAAIDTRECILEHPFSSVLMWLLKVASQPGGAVVLGAEIIEIIDRHDIGAWSVP
jgi:hypothetical protein